MKEKGLGFTPSQVSGHLKESIKKMLLDLVGHKAAEQEEGHIRHNWLSSLYTFANIRKTIKACNSRSQIECERKNLLVSFVLTTFKVTVGRCLRVMSSITPQRT